MKIDAACHCGRVRYEAEVDPERTIICHCTDCQTMSGAPYRVNVPVLADKLHMTGEPRIYVKTGGSGEPVNTAFCCDCGTASTPARARHPPSFSSARAPSASARTWSPAPRASASPLCPGRATCRMCE